LPRERDAWAFIDAAGITSSRQQEAVIQLVRDLKQARLWTKMKAIYPFVGGTATTHKWNLKDPRDTDAAFRLTFAGGWTHSSTGALPNGTNAYADTFFKPGLNMSDDNAHLLYYSRTNSARNATTIGCDDGASPSVGKYFRMTLRYTDNRGLTLISSPDVGLSYFTITDSTGLFVANATATKVRKMYRNGVSLTPSSQTSFGVNQLNSTQNVFIGALRSPAFIPAVEYDNKECAFASLGDGFTDTEATLLYNCVDRYQKFLGRAV
jgi:hypothetical protein